MTSRDLSKDSRTDEELFAATLLGEHDDDVPWDAVSTLRMRGTPEVFELAKKNSAAVDPKARARALDVLAQLGAGKPVSERPFLDESIAIAIHCISDPEPLVVHAAAWALAHLGGDRSSEALIAMQANPDPDIRHAVAIGLHCSQQPESVATLIKLMDDGDEEVRDWATFALGAGFPVVDSTEIRVALHKRLQDPYEDAVDEAVWGLALRKDPLGLKMLLERLNEDDWKPGDESTAIETLDLLGDTTIEQLRTGLRDLIGTRD